MNAAPFAVPFQGTVLLGDHAPASGTTATVLVLHGGGTSAAAGFGELRAHLAAAGIASAAYDAVGHGRTGGPQLGTTLHERIEQVLAVVRHLDLDPATLVLAGFSMGAYVAAKAADRLAPAGLCLAIPAAYDPRAENVPFGPGFTEILRTPRSWAASDSFDGVARYRGHLLVVSAEHDAVVPAEIPQRYAACAAAAASVTHHVIAGAGHRLDAHYQAHPAAQRAVYDAITGLCRRAVPAVG